MLPHTVVGAGSPAKGPDLPANIPDHSPSQHHRIRGQARSHIDRGARHTVVGAGSPAKRPVQANK
ncbi:hypothetical protein PRJ_3966 [Pseudomonas sp. XWY-1]|nr:hypothetical protein PRJ_3966 [Pseudomonas sp. XWY-1]